MNFAAWEGFNGGAWQEGINVRDFIQNNYTPYDGDESFLEAPTEATEKLWDKSFDQNAKNQVYAKGGNSGCQPIQIPGQKFLTLREYRFQDVDQEGEGSKLQQRRVERFIGKMDQVP